MQKICSDCKIEKPIAEFWKGQRRCIPCSKTRYASTYEKARGKDVRTWIWGNAFKRAKTKGIAFTISPHHIEVPEVCPILQVPMQRHRGKARDNSYSLDRVDSSKGYVPGNVRVISWRANYMKNEMTLEQIERMALYVKGEL